MNNVLRRKIKKKCILCGNCYAVCPKNAIAYDNQNEKVIINKNLCVNCGICLKNCPAKDAYTTDTSLLGPIKGIYAGFSNNQVIRYKSASGGLLTETLKFLLENNDIDKVLITTFENYNLQAHSYFTDNVNSVINACGSKYQIVNVNASLKEVLKEDKSYAFVGLPCHIRGLEKIISVNPNIKTRIKYKFAICCSHNTNINILDYAAHYLKINKTDIISIKYRGDGWPEYLTFTLKDNSVIKFPKAIWNYLFMAFFYTPKQCFKCNDFCGEKSDISFADAWLEPYITSKSDGYNLVLSHSDTGEKLLIRMLDNKNIELIPHSKGDFIKAQITGLFYKKYLYSSKQMCDNVYKAIIRFNSFISRHKIFKFVPPLFIKYYFCIINLLYIEKRIDKYKKELINENRNC